MNAIDNYNKAYNQANDRGKSWLHNWIRNRTNIETIVSPPGNWFYILCDNGCSYFISYQDSGAASGSFGSHEDFYNIHSKPQNDDL